jgi:hypothetical protein
LRPSHLTFGALALALLTGAGAAAPPSPVVSPLARPEILDPPAGPGAMAPNLTADPAQAGRGLLMTWLEPRDPQAPDPGKAGHRLRIARLSQGRWSVPVTIAEGTGFFANWADFPAAAAGPNGGLAATWLASLANKGGGGTYDYAIQVARSADSGQTWRRTGILHADRTPAEHGFVSWVAEPAGLRAFWLDGRAMAKGGAMTLRTAGIDAGAKEEVVDPRVCECCQTDAARTAEGTVVVFRNRSEKDARGKEIRDIYIARRTAAGWAAPAPVHADGWEITGCPVNGPAVAAAGRDVAVAWFTGAQGRPRAQLAFSRDAGVHFGPPVEIGAGGPLGRVDVLLTGAGKAGPEAIVSWLAVASTGKQGAAVHLRRAGPRGLGAPVTVAATGAGRSSGFPRLAHYGKDFAVAWVEDGETSRVHFAVVPAAAVP